MSQSSVWSLWLRSCLSITTPGPADGQGNTSIVIEETSPAHDSDNAHARYSNPSNAADHAPMTQHTTTTSMTATSLPARPIGVGSLSVLPSELVEHIVNKATLETRVALRGVCRDFRALCSESYVEYKWANQNVHIRKYNRVTERYERVREKCINIDDRRHPDAIREVLYVFMFTNIDDLPSPMIMIPLFKKIAPYVKSSDLSVR